MVQFDTSYIRDATLWIQLLSNLATLQPILWGGGSQRDKDTVLTGKLAGTLICKTLPAQGSRRRELEIRLYDIGLYDGWQNLQPQNKPNLEQCSESRTTTEAVWALLVVVGQFGDTCSILRDALEVTRSYQISHGNSILQSKSLFFTMHLILTPCWHNCHVTTGRHLRQHNVGRAVNIAQAKLIRTQISSWVLKRKFPLYVVRILGRFTVGSLCQAVAW